MNMNAPENNIRFLAGGGEMGALIRAKDWSKTSVGNPASWPQSLRTTLNILLNSKFPMFLWWGPELICFYNDAYRPSLGEHGKHPDILGMKAEEAWPEIWSIIKPLIDQVRNTGEATWNENQLLPIFRNGNIEDVYWTFSYSPVQDENGNVEGVLVVCHETTNQIITLKKLQDSEVQFRNLIKESPIATSLFRGPEFVIEVANEEALHLWGKNNNIIGKKLIDAIPELENQPYMQILENVYKTGETYYGNENLAYLEIGGMLTPVYVNFIYKALQNADEKTWGILCMGYNVSKQIEGHRKLEDAEERLRLALEATELATWDLDLHSNEIIHSPRLAEIFGHNKNKILTHQQMRSQMNPDDLHNVIEKAFDVALQTSVYRYEARVLKPDNTMCWIRTQGKVFYDEEKRPAKMIGTLRDITDQKMFSQELEKKISERTEQLKQMNDELKKSEERYHLMVSEVEDYAILYLNKDGIIENWNKGAEKIKGYKAEEIVGKNFSVFYTEEDKQNHLPETLLQRAEKTGRASHEGWRARKNSSLFWGNIVITALRDDQKNVIGFSKVTRDLTEKKEADDNIQMKALQLEQKNKELEKMNAELQSFAYVSSHDLQEPLRKIQTFATLILEKEKQNLSDKGKDYFRRMQLAAKRMQLLIDDLLAYSRTSTVVGTFVKTNLNEIIAEVKSELKETLEEKHAIIESEGMCTIDIIPFQFRQLMLNLIGNSLKFSKHEIPPHIKLKCEIANGDQTKINSLSPEKMYCHVSVSDNGIGFDPKYADRIFEVFQRLHGKDQYEGTGIGLAIVKKIVENHNGIITATGEPDKGARFDIYFPA